MQNKKIHINSKLYIIYCRFGGELGSTGMKDVKRASPSWSMARLLIDRKRNDKQIVPNNMMLKPMVPAFMPIAA